LYAGGSTLDYSSSNFFAATSYLCGDTAIGVGRHVPFGLAGELLHVILDRAGIGKMRDASER
jgi:hypothetical protein